MNEYLELSPWQVAIAAALMLMNAAVSLLLQLRLEKSLLLAGIRTILQLSLIGLVLEWVFSADSWLVVILLACAMTLIAGVTAAGRIDRRYAGVRRDSVLALWISSWPVTAFALLAVLSGIGHWYQPQYAIPFLGMVLGNTLNGISLGLNSLTDALAADRGQVESLLAIGATRWEAARGPARRAVRTGMIPIINAMMVVGLVSLPGMMTGQLVSGVPPIDAVKYQIVIMFLIATATTIGTVAAVLLGIRRLFSPDHRLLGVVAQSGE